MLLYWEFHPLRVSGRETIGYGKQKVKCFKESITDFVATACDLNKEDILSDNEPTCRECTDMDRLINATKEKIILALNQNRYKYNYSRKLVHQKNM